MDLRTGYLNPEAPFSYEQSLSYIHSYPASAHDHKINSEQLIKAFRVGNKTYAMQLMNKGNRENPRLKLTIISTDKMTDDELEQAIQRVRFFLGVDDNVKEFYELSEEDRLFKPIVNRLYGHHVAKFLTIFEAAVWSLLKTNLTLKEAIKAKKELQRRLGAMINVNGINYRSFPEPHDIIDSPDDELNLTLSQDRIRNRVYNLASYLADVSSEELEKQTNDEIKDQFLQLDGIDQNSALFILNYGLGRMDEVHYGNPKLVKAVEKTYGTHKEINLNKIKDIASHYDQWKGYWAHYLITNHERHS